MKLRFGTFLAPNVLSMYQAIADAVAEQLGVETELTVETDYENCRKDVNDVCFICSLPYVMFEREGVDPAVPIAAPVLRGDRYEGRPIYFSDVIVPTASPSRSFDDLRGASWAYNEPLSHSGYGITRYHLLSMGETDGFFGQVIEAGYHETAIEMVRSSEVDGSAIDSQVLAVAMQDDPSLAEAVRVVDALGPSTIQPVAMSRRIEPGLRDAVRDVLLGIAEYPPAADALDHALVERFVAVGPSDYDDIRQMLQACEDAGFTELR